MTMLIIIIWFLNLTVAKMEAFLSLFEKEKSEGSAVAKDNTTLCLYINLPPSHVPYFLLVQSPSHLPNVLQQVTP